MISFINTRNEEPYLLFEREYNYALNANQKNIEAICISSYSSHDDIVDSRFVNLKFLNDNKFIFFSNYESPKAIQFRSHKQVCAVIFWNSSNTQIRIHANIDKISEQDSDEYFNKRPLHKNALSVSSNQSKKIRSYSMVEDNYRQALGNDSAIQRPQYWGGFSFIPYYFEFWKGHESRINKRLVFEKINTGWEKHIIQP